MSSVIFDRVIFSDIVNVASKRVQLNLNIDALKYSIQNLLSTIKGERLNLVRYGVNIPDYLFDQIDDTTSWNLINGIIFAINEWEPRVAVDRNKSYVTPIPDENSYEIFLTLYVVGYPGIDFEVSGIYKKLMTD